MGKLEDVLVKESTHPDLITLLLLAVGEEDTPDQEQTGNDKFGIGQVVEEQQQVGWRLVKYGFVTRAQAATQQRWTETTSVGSTQQRNGRWIKKVQGGLWDNVTAIWDNRNAQVHGRNLSNIAPKRLEKL